MKNPEPPMKESEPEYAPVPKYLIPGLVAALIAWGLYLAIGAAFPEVGPGQAARQAAETATAQSGTAEATPSITEQPTERPVGQATGRTDWSNFRPWRGLVVLVCSAFFLAWFWGLQKLYVRRHQR